MLAFVRSSVAGEVKHLHPTLWRILQEIADASWLTYTGQENVYVTDIYRTHEETIRIYTEAGQPVPVASVHELGRGCDLSVRAWRPGTAYQDWPYLPAKLVREFVAALNKRWRYQASEKFQVAHYHNVAGWHVHLQVRPGTETVLREFIP